MRYIPLVVLAAATSGCAVSFPLFRSQPADIELLCERARGRQVTLFMADGSGATGVAVSVTADSIAWSEQGRIRSASILHVERVVRARQVREVSRWAVIGAGCLR